MLETVQFFKNKLLKLSTIFSLSYISSLRYHCVKDARIRSFSGPYFPVFRLNTKRFGVSLRIQSECGKTLTRKTPNTDTLYAVSALVLIVHLFILCIDSFVLHNIPGT